jgi:hypothetical protein
MKNFLLSFVLLFSILTTGFGQLPSGSIAPAFTVTDLDGNVHDLYTYLNSGISVVVDVSATWCGPCWSYHNSGTLENFYNNYGPSGTGDVMVIFAEGDPNTNLACLYGPTGCVGGTQGNWVAGTPYPITHTDGPLVRSLYQVNAYPTVFMISAGNNRSYTTGGGGISTAILSNYVLQSFKLAATADVVDAVCGGDGAITLNVTAGYGNKTYAWSNGSTSKDISNLTPGAYICTITDANNYYIVTEPFIVSGTYVPVTGLNGPSTQPSCYGGTNGSVSMLATGGNGGYQYAWDNGQTTSTKTNIGAGEHYVTITDALGCTFESLSILDQPTPVAASVQAPPIPCGQSTGTATISASGGVSPYSYNLGSGSQSSGVFSNLSANNYNYTVTDNKGCNLQGNFTLTAITGPTSVAASNGNITCLTSQTQVSGTGSASGSNIAYLWTTQNGTILSGQNQLVATVSAGGTYTLQVTNTTNNCVSSASTVVVADVALPQIAIANPSTLTCLSNQTTLQGSLQGDINEHTVLWTTSNGNIMSGANTLNPVVNADGAYNMLVTKNASGCLANAQVTVNEDINTPNGAYQYTLNGNTFTGQAAASGSTTTYAWDFGNGATSTEANPSIALTPGTFNICLTVTNECGNNTVCQQVTYSTVLTLAPTTIDVVCHGENNGQAFSNVSGGVAPIVYDWASPNGNRFTTANINGLAPGVYTLVVTDATNASLTQSVTINEPAIIRAASVSIINDSNNQNLGAINLVADGGTGSLTYLWSNGATTQNLAGIGSGNYSCVVTDGAGCSKSFGPFTVENTSSIDETKYVSSFSVYPNPATSLINLEVNFVKATNVTLNITNSLGAQIVSRHYTGDIKDNVDVSGLTSGIYFVTIKGEQFSVARRVVVLR